MATVGRVAKGIRRTRYGWQVYVRAEGEFRSKHFRANTPMVHLVAWRDEQLSRRPEPVRAGTLEADADAYLRAVAGMPPIADRRHHIRAWVAALGGGRARTSVTPLEIRQQLERWRTERDPITGKVLTPASINRRRSALMHFYRTLDPAGDNPVRLVPRFRETAPVLHLPTLAQPNARSPRSAARRRARAYR